MQIEIKQIHTMLGVTIVYVTHDLLRAQRLPRRGQPRFWQAVNNVDV